MTNVTGDFWRKLFKNVNVDQNEFKKVLPAKRFRRGIKYEDIKYIFIKSSRIGKSLTHIKFDKNYGFEYYPSVENEVDPERDNLKYLKCFVNLRAIAFSKPFKIKREIYFLRSVKKLEYFNGCVETDNLYTNIITDKFTKLKILILTHHYHLLPDSFVNYVNLTYLKLDIGNQNVDCLSRLINLTYLELKDQFNQPIDFISSIRKLKHLKFGKDFNQPIDALSGLASLIYLKFGDYFNQPIDPLFNLTELQFLGFGLCFDQKIDIIANLTKLEHLDLGYFVPEATDDVVSVISKLDNIKYIDICIWLFRSLSDIRNLRNIKSLKGVKLRIYDSSDIVRAISVISKLGSLEFHYLYNEPIDNLSRLKLQNLKNLKFNKCFNQPINALAHLTSLKSIEFGDNFNQPIDALAHLKSLEFVKFGNNFDQPIEQLSALGNLKYIEFGEMFNQSINILGTLGKLQTVIINSPYTSAPSNNIIPPNELRHKFKCHNHIPGSNFEPYDYLDYPTDNEE
jgi:hypothetical protein